LDELEVGDVLVVTKLDRLARSTLDLLRTIDLIGKEGAGFKMALQDQVALNTVIISLPTDAVVSAHVRLYLSGSGTPADASTDRTSADCSTDAQHRLEPSRPVLGHVGQLVLGVLWSVSLDGAAG